MSNGFGLGLSGDNLACLTQKKAYMYFLIVIRLSQEQKESTGKGGV